LQAKATPLEQYIRDNDPHEEGLKDMYAQGVYVRVSRSVMLDGLTIEDASGIYDTMYSRFHYDEDFDRVNRKYQEWTRQDPTLVGHEIIEIHDLNTPAARTRRLGLSAVMNFNDYSKVYARTHHSTVGAKQAFVDYHFKQSNEIQANLEKTARNYRVMKWLLLKEAQAVIDPVGTLATTAVELGLPPILVRAGVPEYLAAGLGELGSIVTGYGVGYAQMVRAPASAPATSVQKILRSERAARAEAEAALLAKRAAEYEASMGIRISEDVTLFKGIPAEARAARRAVHVPALLDAPAAPPPSLVVAGDTPMSGGVPALAGRHYAPYSYGGQSMLSYEASASRHLSDVALTDAFEPQSRLVANISSGGGAAQAGVFKNVVRGRATDRGVGVLWIKDASKLSSAELRDVISAVKDMDWQAGIAGGLVRQSIPERSVANRVAAIARGKKGMPGPLNLGPTQAAGHIPDAAGGGSPLGPIIGLPEKINKSWGGQWKRYEPGFTFEGFSLYDKASRQYIYPSLSLEHAPNPNITF
jgi:hypothetical protein